MSNFDPTVPDYVPPGSILAFDGSTYNPLEGNGTATVAFSGSLSASTAVSILNHGCRGALFVLNVTSLPGSASTTIALKLRTTSPAAFVFAARAAVSATGAVGFMVYPGISASAGGVSSPLPKRFEALLSISTGATSKECVLSLTHMKID